MGTAIKKIRARNRNQDNLLKISSSNKNKLKLMPVKYTGAIPPIVINPYGNENA